MEGLGIDILVPDQKLEEIGALEGFARVPTFAIVGLLAPFGEEVFFRGFLLAGSRASNWRFTRGCGQFGDILGGALASGHFVSHIRNRHVAGLAVLADGFDMAFVRGTCGTESAGTDIPGITN